MSRPEAPFAVCWSSVSATDAAHSVIEAAQRWAAAYSNSDGDVVTTTRRRIELLRAVHELAIANTLVRREWGEDTEPDSKLADALAACLDGGDS